METDQGARNDNCFLKSDAMLVWGSAIAGSSRGQEGLFEDSR